MVASLLSPARRFPDAECRQDCARGYASAAFAEVYREFGEPRRLPACGGSVLVRPIGETNRTDAMGCYPLFSCQDWKRLGEDLTELGRDCVSLVLVADPFAPLTEADLRQRFDLVAPFKQHFVAELSQATRDFVAGDRYRRARTTLRRMTVEVAESANSGWIDDWMALQSELDSRHVLLGMRRLSREATARLFETPGVVIFRAILDGVTAGMHVDFIDGDRAYAHLAAYSAAGYRANISTALYVFEIDFLRGRVDRIDWGGVAGLADDHRNGLGLFKACFSNARVTAYLCGKIFDRRAYDAMAQRRGSFDASYFPAYRAGERM